MMFQFGSTMLPTNVYTAGVCVEVDSMKTVYIIKPKIINYTALVFTVRYCHGFEEKNLYQHLPPPNPISAISAYYISDLGRVCAIL